MDRKFITPTEAISLLKNGDYVHTFRNSAEILVGCDIKRENLIERLNANPDKIEIAGETARQMNHAIVLDDGNYLFIENDKEKLDIFDPM